MRMQIHDAFRQLSDVDYQNELWKEPSAHEVAKMGKYGDINIPIHILFDDTPGLAEMPSNTVGDYLANEEEAHAVKDVILELNKLILKYQGKGTAEQYLDDSSWSIVVDKAKIAYSLMEANGVDKNA